MKIIKPYFEIKTDISEAAVMKQLKAIEETARTCYKSEDRITEDGESAKKMIANLIKNGHEAMLEHSSLSVKFICDRGISHELVRHRLCSFAQESTRYCVAGDMRLTLSNPHITGMTVEELYKKRIESTNGAWKRINVRQYNEETGELQFAGIKEIVCNGDQQCVRIKTKLGYELVCTYDHRILTPDGYREAGQIKTGEKVYVNGTEALYTNYDWLYDQNITQNKTFVEIANEFGFNVNTVKKWAKKLKIPKKGTGYFNVGRVPWNKNITDDRQAAALRKYHHCGRRKEGIMKLNTVNYQKHMGSTCEVCGNTDDLEMHHIDKNRNNNDPDNLFTVCKICHSRIHSQNLLTAYADEVVEIIDDGIHTVYDIEMNSQCHNFVANGVIVHNCNYGNNKFGKEITVIEPSFLSGRLQEYAIWKIACECAEKAYFDLLDAGSTPQEARSVLPNSLKTEITLTTNFREWRSILKLRTQNDVHPQLLELTRPLLDKLQDRIPVIFDDITY